MTIPEKFLVDLAADKILRDLIAQSQLEYISEGYLNHYQIDTKKMLRYAGINYTVYFLSRTLEHVLHNRIENLTDQDKTELSEAFDDSYADNLEGFLAFIADEVFAVKGDYKQTWDFIKQDTNSLKRYSNLHLLFEAKKRLTFQSTSFILMVLHEPLFSSFRIPDSKDVHIGKTDIRIPPSRNSMALLLAAISETIVNITEKSSEYLSRLRYSDIFVFLKISLYGVAMVFSVHAKA